MDDVLDRFPHRPCNIALRNDLILSLCSDLSLVDAWRFYNQDSQEYTWSNKNVSFRSRIYFFLISSSIPHLVKDISHSFAPLSDHKQILINLVGLQPVYKMRGYWKLKNALLKDTKFNNSIINLAKELFTNVHNGYKERWEYFKYKSGLIVINRCKELKASRLQTEYILLCRLN